MERKRQVFLLTGPVCTKPRGKPLAALSTTTGTSGNGLPTLRSSRSIATLAAVSPSRSSSRQAAGESEAGRPNPAFDVRADEVTAVEQVLTHGQAKGLLGAFSARVMAASLKAVLDDLLTQFAADPDLDIEAYGTELAALFERAARPDPGAGPAIAPGQAPPV